jgi:hypothetical protein
MAKELTKTVDGAPLTADKFAAVGDPSNIDTWHLPLDTHKHVNSALDMYAHTDLPSSLKAPAARKIVARAKEEGLDTTDFVKNHLSSQTHGEAPRPWIEIFRAGDYSKAGKGTITPDDLHRVARAYDPTYHEAPETLGHRSDDQPAFGWIDGLMVDGDKLLARERQVDPKFAEARKAGKFKKRSAAFYTDENGQVTGLRHLAWLGAGIPEVKGLQDVNFDDHGSKFIMVDFGEEEAVAQETKTVAEQIKAYFAELFGGNAQPATFSEADVTRIATEAATAAAAPLQQKIATLETDLTAQKTQFAERERALAGGATKLKAEQAVTKLKGAGKWIPAFDKAGVPVLFDELAKLTVTVEFGEGAEKKPTAPFDMLLNFLEGLPKIVPGGRLVEGAPRAAGGPSTGDPLTDLAKTRQKEKNISFSEALDQVVAEQPELATAGRSTAGAI